MNRLFLVCAGAIAATGCVAERTDSTFAPQEIADVGQVGDAALGNDVGFGAGPGAGTMAGTWLLAHQASNCVLNQEQVSLAFYLVEIDEERRVLSESRRICELELSPVLGLRPIIPAAVRESIEFVQLDNGYVSAPTLDGAYTSSTEVALWGVSLDAPETDPLPTDADDPRVIDADGDGNPGVTFEIEGSECLRFVSQRQVVRYQGIFVAPNLIEGRSLTITDSVLYDSTQPLCGVNPQLVPNDALSTFRMGRVDGAGGSVDADADGDGGIRCDEVEPLFLAAIERREPDPSNCR